MKRLFMIVVLAVLLALSAPASAEANMVPAINTAADIAVIVPETALEQSSMFQLAEIVVEVADGAFFLVTSGGGLDARKIFMGALIAQVKEQLKADSISADYQLFSVVKVQTATAEQMEPILLSLVNGYIVESWFTCGGAYSFAW